MTQPTKCSECKNEVPLVPDWDGVVFHDITLSEPGSTAGWWTQCSGSGLPPLAIENA